MNEQTKQQETDGRFSQFVRRILGVATAHKQIHPVSGTDDILGERGAGAVKPPPGKAQTT